MRLKNHLKIVFITTIVRVLRAVTYHRMNGNPEPADTDSAMIALG
jgi:hypothetical protein